MDYYSVISRFDPQRHEFYRYEFRWPARLHHTMRVLLVAHGKPELTRVVEAVTTELPYHINVEVTTAQHASSRGLGGAGNPDLTGFRFTTTDLAAYDQVWLVTAGGAPDLAPGELTALYAFMQSGGGLYATGDGGALFRRIPRVRSMRNWARASGAGAVPNSPVVVKPVQYPVGWPSLRRPDSAPHPVMCGRDGPITVLPPPSTRGRIEAAVDGTARVDVEGTVVDEFPYSNGEAPTVIAVGAGPDAPDDGDFNLVSTYDGHRAGVGRIVVDATGHGLFATIVEQLVGPHDAVRAVIAANGTPSIEQVSLADHWRQIKDYFQNVAIWLGRADSQERVRRLGLLLSANHVDALMTWRPHEIEEPERRLPYLRELGARAQEALHRFAPQRQRIDVAADVLRQLRIDGLVTQWRLRLIDHRLVEQVALGGAVDALHRAVSERDYAELPGGRLDEIVRGGAEAAVVELIAELRAGVETLSTLLGKGDEPPDPRFVVHSGHCVG
jgi:hypothetical protein